MADPAAPVITPWSCLHWLSRGWADLRAHPWPGLAHGAVITLFGQILLLLAHDRFWLLAGAFSGFLIVSPILATGLYAVSRALAEGRRLGPREVLAVWRSGDRRLMRFGLLLGLAGTGWVLTSAGLITLGAPVPVERPVDFLRYVVLAPEPGLFEVWLLQGALLAAPVFASTVVALPMLVDRPVPVHVAVGASWRAVASHPFALTVWALEIALLVGLGMAFALLGLVVLIPWLAHASWHAYRDLVPQEG